MQSNLVNPKITASKIISLDEFRSLSSVYEFLLYSDNILEGIALLNMLTNSDYILAFYGVVYEPIDQPIYIFRDEKGRLYAIKICGTYNKWNLPRSVDNIRKFIDLPDYIFYSLTSNKPILAGENTETASVGNSQWQREGRKLGAAKNGVPFIYQTFYSGKDISQNTVREPTSLQVYNHLLYSIRYKTPSFVAYLENNFNDSSTRVRTPKDAKELFEQYIKSVLVSDVDKLYISKQRRYEKDFIIHMLSYLKEGKYGRNGIGTEARLKLDFPVINSKIEEALLEYPEKFASDLDKYLYNEDDGTFITQYPIDEINYSLLTIWKAYEKKTWISEMLSFLKKQNKPALSYITGNVKIGIADLSSCKNYLINKFPHMQTIIHTLLSEQYKEVIIIPLRICKKSNGILTFSPDPESGEIVAFCELFGYDYRGNKNRPVIGYGIVETPEYFDIKSKKGTKLYKAIANYIDILVLNNSVLITQLENEIDSTDEYSPSSLINTIPLMQTEETAVVSTYLNMSTIRAGWLLCFIHTHHSSWQQLIIHQRDLDTYKRIERVSTKVDLIMQDAANIFMVAEGKNDYFSLLSDTKIQTAMKNAGKIIDSLCLNNHIKFDAFIYNLPTQPNKDPEYYVKIEYVKVEGAIKLGHFSDVTSEQNFIVIIVYTDIHNKTKFKLVYSPYFDEQLKNKLDLEFNQ